MARLVSSGFELNSIAASGAVPIEVWNFSASGTNPSVQTSVVRSGTYALRASGSTTTGMMASTQICPVNPTTPFYFRVYIRVAALPSRTTSIMNVALASSSSTAACITLTTGGALQLRAGGVSGTQVGSNSSALSLNTWYRLEVFFDNTAAAGSDSLTARIDGTDFASSTSLTLSSNPAVALYLQVGKPDTGGFSETTGDIYFDDIAVNDNTGSFQNSWPGDGSIIRLVPNAAGDANQWDTDAASGDSNNYTHVDEVTPNDVTDYVEGTTLNWVDMYNVGASGIGASDTVNVVSVGGRFVNGVAADATTQFKFRVEKAASGTVLESAAITPNSTTWRTNATAAPFTYPITTYQDPDASSWTQTTLDSMQVGVKATLIGVRPIRVSAVWALVDYTPYVAPPGGTNSGFFGLM